MTQLPPPDLTPLAAGERVGEFRIVSLTGQESVSGYAVQHYEVAAEAVSSTGTLYLRRILPPPPAARTEAEWLATLQGRPAAERSAFTPALAAWSDTQASYLVRRERSGQSLQAYLAGHPPLPATDGEILARGLLTAVGQLHAEGLHLPKLGTAHVWLGSGGEVGLRDLWAALPEDEQTGSVGADLRRVGAVLREAVGVPAAGTPLARLLQALRESAGSSFPISAGAALRLLEAPTVTSGEQVSEPITTTITTPAPAVTAQSPVTPLQSAGPEVAVQAPPPQSAAASVPTPASRPLWPWLLPIAALLLAGIVYLAWPQISAAFRGSSTVQTKANTQTTSAQATQTSNQTQGQGGGGNQIAGAAAPSSDGAAQVMTLPATLNLRPSADTSGAPLAELPTRSVVTVLSEKGDWLKVRAGDLTGWINAGYTVPVLSAAEVEALRSAAGKGGRIALTRGVYLLDAPLTLQWDTDLIGQGRDQTYLLGRSGESVLLSRDVRLTLEGLAVVWNGDGPGQPVQVERGSLCGEDIWLTGGVPDDAARVRGSGLWLRAGAHAQITGSSFTRNAIGISAEDSALTLSGSEVNNNRFAGLMLSGSSSGQIQENTLAGNAEDGILISGSASPNLQNNQIRGSLKHGVDISGSATPTLSGNRIEGATFGISVSGQAAPELHENALDKAAETGLAYAGQAAGVAEGNTVSGSLTGIALTEKAAPTLRGNQILSMRGDGLSYGGAAGGTASENAIESSRKSGIAVAGEAEPTLEANRVLRGAGSGILLEGRSQAQLRRNTVQAQGQNGIVVSGEAQALLEQNALLDNGNYGLVFKELGRASAERNLCQNNHAGPALLQVAAVTAGPSFSRDGCLDGIIWPPPAAEPAPTPTPEPATPANPNTPDPAYPGPATAPAPAPESVPTPAPEPVPEPAPSQPTPAEAPTPAAAQEATPLG